jgi:hypothetical protein
MTPLILWALAATGLTVLAAWLAWDRLRLQGELNEAKIDAKNLRAIAAAEDADTDSAIVSAIERGDVKTVRNYDNYRKMVDGLAYADVTQRPSDGAATSTIEWRNETTYTVDGRGVALSGKNLRVVYRAWLRATETLNEKPDAV